MQLYNGSENLAFMQNKWQGNQFIHSLHPAGFPHTPDGFCLKLRSQKSQETFSWRQSLPQRNTLAHPSIA